MNIGQISYHYQPIRGGQEVYVDALRRLLVASGHACRVYQASRRHYPGISSFPTVPTVGRFFPRFNYHVFNLMLRCFGRRRLATEDVIIAHYALAALPVWDWPDRVIVLSHGVEWRTEEPGFEDRWIRHVASRALGRFTTVANDTHYYRTLGLDVAPGVPGYRQIAPRCWYIPNAVDTALFRKSAPTSALTGTPSILVPRQINEERGIDLAIAAMPFVRSQYPKAELHIAGTPLKGAYYRHCAEMVARADLSTCVRFHGFVDHAGLPSWYSAASLTLIPTRRREGTSLSAIESMSCGTATISTSAGGLADLPTVKTLPTPEAIADCIVRTIPDAFSTGSRQAKEVRATFNLEHWNAAWLQVLRSISTPAQSPAPLVNAV